MNTPTLSIPYDLGFDVAYPSRAHWSQGNNLVVRLQLFDEVCAGAADEYGALAVMFFSLANTGALCGREVSPELSGIDDCSEPEVLGSTLSIVFRGCHLDDRATVLCANAFSLGHDRYPISRLAFELDAYPDHQEQLTYKPEDIDPYPECAISLPFEFFSDPAEDAISVFIEFGQSLDEGTRSDIETSILTWAAVCSSGIYASVTAPPQDSFLSFSPADLDFSDNSLSLFISQFHCHPAALRGLTNVLMKLHATTIPVLRLMIE